MRGVGLLCTACYLAACAASSTVVDERVEPAPIAVEEAPPPEQVETIAELPMRSSSVDPSYVPAAAGASPHQIQSLWDHALMRALGNEVGRNQSDPAASQSMHCLAEKVARWYVKERRLPSALVKRRMELRCGTRGVGSDVRFISAEVPAPAPDDASLWDLWQGELHELLSNSIADRTRSMEIGFAVLVAAPLSVAVVAKQDVPMILEIDGDPARVRISGKLHQMAEGIALVRNEGPLNYRVCSPSGSRALPSFEFDCGISSAESQVYELFVRRPGRRISDLVSRFELTTEPQPRQLDIDFSKVELNSDNSAGPLWLRYVNTLRAYSGYPSLQFEAEQSRVLNKAYPAYIDALTTREGASDAEAMALEILAGWHASVPVINGAMTNKLVESPDVTEWLRVVLGEPSARMVLFNPDASRVAASFREVEHEGRTSVTGLVVTYETLNMDHRDQARRDLRERWNHSNPGRGEDVLTSLRGAVLSDAEAGRLTRRELLDRLLDGASQELGCEVRATIIETQSLESVRPPDWLGEYSGSFLLDVAYLGRSSSAARLMWVVVMGLSSECRK